MSILAPGVKVQITGTAMDGSLGEIVEWLAEKERWKIKFASGSTKNFKTENLEHFNDEKPALPEGITKFWKIYVTNLPDKVTGADLVDFFGKVGTVAKEPQLNQDQSPIGFKDEWPYAVKIYRSGKEKIFKDEYDRDRDDKREATAALIEYEDHNAAHEALRINGKLFKGIKIGVEVAGTVAGTLVFKSGNGQWNVGARSVRRQEAQEKNDNYRKEHPERSRSRGR